MDVYFKGHQLHQTVPRNALTTVNSKLCLTLFRAIKGLNEFTLIHFRSNCTRVSLEGLTLDDSIYRRGKREEDPTIGNENRAISFGYRVC